MRETLELTTPRDWEPEEALAVWELLTELADQLWAQHRLGFMQLLCERQTPDAADQHRDDPRKPSQRDPLEPDDDLPF